MHACRSTLEDPTADLRDAFDRGFAEPAEQVAKAPVQALQIRVGASSFLLRLAATSGVVKDRPITPLPTTTPGLIGLLGHRGAIVPVFDLATLLTVEGAEQPRWVVLVSLGDDVVGLACARFEGQRDLEPAAIAPASNAVHVEAVATTVAGAIPILSLTTLVGALRRSREGVTP